MMAKKDEIGNLLSNILWHGIILNNQLPPCYMHVRAGVLPGKLTTK